jgi:hypothetical protein
MYVEHIGNMTVKNLRTGDYTIVTFKSRGWSGKNACDVDGHLFSSVKDKKYRIYGNWTKELIVKNLENN